MDIKLMILIAVIIAVIIYVVGCAILGKKINLKDINSIKSYILAILPDIINGTESLHGADVKKQTAITLTMSLAQEKFGTFKDKDLKTLVNFTGEHIEKILTTPTKKEAKDA